MGRNSGEVLQQSHILDCNKVWYELLCVGSYLIWTLRSVEIFTGRGLGCWDHQVCCRFRAWSPKLCGLSPAFSASNPPAGAFGDDFWPNLLKMERRWRVSTGDFLSLVCFWTKFWWKWRWGEDLLSLVCFWIEFFTKFWWNQRWHGNLLSFVWFGDDFLTKFGWKLKMRWKNLLSCSSRVAVCCVYKVATGLHKSVTLATIENITIFTSMVQNIFNLLKYITF